MRLRLSEKMDLYKKLKQHLSARYSYVGPIFDGLARVQLNDKWGFVNEEGVEVIPPKYDQMFPFSRRFAPVRLNGKWGLINTEGKEVIPLKYDDISVPAEGLAQVRLNDKWGLVNTEGKEVIPPKYDYENIREMPQAVDLLAFKLNVSKEEALKLILEEMDKR